MNVKRPISPFLSIYKPQITSIFSIAERVTGLVLVLVIFIVISIIKLSAMLMTNYTYYSICYTIIKGSVSGFILGGIILFIILNLVYHVIFGIRYLYWDRVIQKITLEEIEKVTPILVGITIIITIGYWLK